MKHGDDRAHYPKPERTQRVFCPFWRESLDNFPATERPTSTNKAKSLQLEIRVPNRVTTAASETSYNKEKMEAFGGILVDEKAVRVENIFLEFLKR